MDRKTAAMSNCYESHAALDTPVKQFKESRGHIYLLYDNCDENLKQEFVTRDGEPLLYKNGIGQYDKDNQLNREFACKYNCVKILKMIDKTLAKVLDKAQIYEGHYYRHADSKLQMV